MEFTLLLAGIAVLLFLIVWLLDISKPGPFAEKEGPKVYFNKELLLQASEERLPADYATSETMIALQAKVNAMGKKAEMAHSRINDLEQEMVLAKSSSIEETKLLPLEKKLEKLDSFRAETETEIKALKEIISGQLSPGKIQAFSNHDSLKRQDEAFLESQIYKTRIPRGRHSGN